MQELIASLSQGEKFNDTELLARLVSLLAPILTAPFGTPEQTETIERVLELDRAAATGDAGIRVAAANVPAHRSTPNTQDTVSTGSEAT
jgi:hypothetical protein